jgi:hypothetical protein
VAAMRPWLIVLAAAFLAIGLIQLYRSKGACQRRSRTTVAMFWTAAIIVLLVMVFPQALAGFLADLLP